MTHPLIIFGAGASYDYSPLSGGIVSPLTNDLVTEQFLDTALLERYRGAGALLTDAVHQVRNRHKSFEDTLTEMRRRVGDSVEMRSQFAALEFYLKDLFNKISRPNDATRQRHQINNYLAILNRLHTHTSGEACVITFNYDTLFENNLGAEAPKSMSDYVSSGLKIIKLHGSHDWVYALPKNSFGRPDVGAGNDYGLYIKNLEYVDELRQKNALHPQHEAELRELSDGIEYARFPAIAAPLAGKDSYICPAIHIRALERLLPSIDRVLIIGWKASDTLLLDTLKKHLPPSGYQVLVVSSTLDGAKQIAETVREKLSAQVGQFATYGNGFSGFAADDISHSFFSE